MYITFDVCIYILYIYKYIYVYKCNIYCMLIGPIYKTRVLYSVYWNRLHTIYNILYDGDISCIVCTLKV